jgi:hypothetical protein
LAADRREIANRWGPAGRKERDREEVEEAHPHEIEVVAANVAEDSMMRHPELADHEEAQDEDEELRSEVSKTIAQLGSRSFGNWKLDDQQRDRDRKDGVAEECSTSEGECQTSGARTSLRRE